MCKQVPNPFLWHVLLCNGYNYSKSSLYILFLSCTSLYFVGNFIYCSLSYISSPPRCNHHAKSVTYSFFEVSSYKCPSTLHIKAVVGPEYIVLQISSATLRKLIYKDSVTNSMMLLYILIC